MDRDGCARYPAHADDVGTEPRQLHNGTVIELRNGRVQYPMLHGEIAELQDAEIPNPLRSVDVGIPTSIDLRQ